MVIIGAGGVGLNVVSGAVLASAGKIISVDLNQESLDAAKSFGATHTINSAETDPVAAVKELTGATVFARSLTSSELVPLYVRVTTC